MIKHKRKLKIPTDRISRNRSVGIKVTGKDAQGFYAFDNMKKYFKKKKK